MARKFICKTVTIGPECFELEVFADLDREFSVYFTENSNPTKALVEPPLYGALWPAAEGLAHALIERDLKNIRVLEIGCGLGLPALVCTRLGAEVSCLDSHPEVGPLLMRNTSRNGLCLHNFFQMSLLDDPGHLGHFDLVIGSDILYEPESYQAIENFILRHTKIGGEVLIADPGRYAASNFGSRLKQQSCYQLSTRTIHKGTLSIDLHQYKMKGADYLRKVQ